MTRRGFTLLEIVLAIGLSGAVIALLTTAISLYLVRVDASRNQVETAQLARTILDHIADDIRAARYVAADDSTDPQTDFDGTTLLPAGIQGTAVELRIDRSSAPRWDWIVGQQTADQSESTTADATFPPHMPQTVRYLMGEGKELLPADWASTGVSAEPLTQGYAGLYREQQSTGAWLQQNSQSVSAGATSNSSIAELFAPEVVSIQFAYFDGQELLAEWDLTAQGTLPKAIEVRLTLLKMPFMQDNAGPIAGRDELRRKQENLVEYRRFVRLTGTEQADSDSSNEELEEDSAI